MLPVQHWYRCSIAMSVRLANAAGIGLGRCSIIAIFIFVGTGAGDRVAARQPPRKIGIGATLRAERPEIVCGWPLADRATRMG